MKVEPIDPRRLALVIHDMQDDFVGPDGAFARAGLFAPMADPVISRIPAVASAIRAAGGLIVSTHFTLMEDCSGEPLISTYLRKRRPFLGRGDFQLGSPGHDVITPLQALPHHRIEKIAFDAFHMTRLETLLRRCGRDVIAFSGIATNAGIETTARSAHVRDLRVLIIEDCCAAFTEDAHDAAIASLATIVEIVTADDLLASLMRSD